MEVVWTSDFIKSHRTGGCGMMPWSTLLTPASCSLQALRAFCPHLLRRGDGRDPACGQEGSWELEEVVFVPWPASFLLQQQ